VGTSFLPEVQMSLNRLKGLAAVLPDARIEELPRQAHQGMTTARRCMPSR
jgi:hypothetical protein